jgi:hypothetical protein
MAYLKLRHKRFDSVKELSGSRMRNLLQVKPPLEGSERLIKFLRFDHGPWDNV